MAFREGSLHESFQREREREVISPSTASLLLLQALRILKQQRVGDWDVVFFIVVFRLPIQSGLRCRGRYQKFRIRRFGYDNLSREGGMEIPNPVFLSLIWNFRWWDDGLQSLEVQFFQDS